MLYGTIVNGALLVSPDGSGLPVAESPGPAEVPGGYEARFSWVASGGEVRQVWEVVPSCGTPAEAALELARMQAASLGNEDALRVAALYPAWSGAGQAYGEGERVLHAGELYRCLQAHESQPGWEPGAAPSLWAEVLPGQSGGVGEWAQPESTEGYARGDRVTHDGRLWESTADANVWEPGTTGAPWEDLGEA